MRHTKNLALIATACLSTTSLATVSTTLVADTYVVKDGSRFYSVLDIYARGNHVGDAISAVLGLNGDNGQSVVFATNKATGSSLTRDGAGRIIGGSIQSDIFVQSGNSNWVPTNTDGKNWDSFIALGNRKQNASVVNRAGVSKALDSDTIRAGGSDNWLRNSNSNFIANGGNEGWFSTLGANGYIGAGTAENPFARMSLYNTADYASLDRSGVLTSKGRLTTGEASAAAAWNNRINPLTTTITGGTSLDFCYMLGRFAIETTGKSDSEVITMQAQFNMVGKNGANAEGGSTFSGAITADYKVSQFFAFAVPAPSAIGVIWPLLLAARRRRN
jgi:hypothetical protein